MKRSMLSVAGLVVVTMVSHGQGWEQRYDGPAHSFDRALALATDAAGNVYVTGFSTDVDEDCFTIKYSATGLALWQQRKSGTVAGNDRAVAIRLSATGVYVAGYVQNATEDFLVMKYDPATGAEQWARFYNGPGSGNDRATSLALDGLGNLLVAGHVRKNGHDEATVVKYDSDGIEQWAVQIPPEVGDLASYATGVATAPGGGVYVCGRYERSAGTSDYLVARLDAGGSLDWVRRYDGPAGSDDYATAIGVDNLGNVYVTGTSTGTTTGFDFATLKYDPDGAQLWVNRHNASGANADEAFCLGLDASGNCFVAGYSNRPAPGTDFAIVKYTAAGSEAWRQYYGEGGGREDTAFALTVDENGNVYVTGTSETPNRWLNILTVKYDNAGNRVWAVSWDGEEFDDGGTAITVSTGAVYVTGYSDGNDQDDMITLKYFERDPGIAAFVDPEPNEKLPPQPLAPQVRFANYGLVTDTFQTYVKLYRGATLVHSDVQTVAGLEPGDDQLVVFRAFYAEAGSYTLRCSTYRAGDQNPVNDTAEIQFVVQWTTMPGWSKLDDDVSPGLSLRGVKDGGALCYGRYTSSNWAVFALKGNGTNEFYRYEISGDTWHQLESLPFAPDRRKTVKKGGALCYDRYDSLVFALKGNSTLEFWKYYTLRDSWTQCESVPAGPQEKKVKGGAGLAFYHAGPDSDLVFCMKGNKTTEFYAYHVQRDTWFALDTLPRTAKGKGWGDGSCLVNAGGTLYALMGSYNWLCAYKPGDGDSWYMCESMPLYNISGRKKKAKMGTAMCFGTGRIFALKGGTCQFWAYYPLADTWIELDSLPRLPSDKPVKGGGALTFGGGYVWALKGNKTFEFWQYYPGTDYDGTAVPEPRTGVQAANVATEMLRFQLFPNPLAKDWATLRLSGKAGRSSGGRLRIFNAAGRCVLVRPLATGNRHFEIPLDVRRLANGIYLVCLEADGATATQELVIQR